METLILTEKSLSSYTSEFKAFPDSWWTLINNNRHIIIFVIPKRPILPKPRPFPLLCLIILVEQFKADKSPIPFLLYSRFSVLSRKFKAFKYFNQLSLLQPTIEFGVLYSPWVTFLSRGLWSLVVLSHEIKELQHREF